MNSSAQNDRSADRRRFWFWLAACLLALAFLSVVTMWTDLQHNVRVQSAGGLDHG